jgi:polysaccharide biosynthesis transport protein
LALHLMRPEDYGEERQRGLADYVAVVARRKWLVVLPVVVVPFVAVALSLRQPPTYEASASVLLGGDTLASRLIGVEDPRLRQPADRVTETQAVLARVPAVTSNALEAAGLPSDRESRASFLQSSAVTVERNTDLLTFTVRNGERTLALKLATAYAQAFTEYRAELDTAAIERARADVQARIAELEEAGERRTALYRTLVGNEQQLATLEALQTSNAFVVQEAERAVQVQPRPMRNGAFGVALALVLGIGLAFLREAFDTRIRSADEVAEALRMPLLARLAEPPRRLRSEHRLVMLASPNSPEAEAYRMLRLNLEFANLGREARTMMVTSAIQGEGKSTTVSNLAVALARAGRRVVLVDLDLRRPIISSLFRLEGRPGLTDVALGRAKIDQALASMAIAPVQRRPRHDSNGRADAAVMGGLKILPSGPLPPNPGEFVDSDALSSILTWLAEHADVVLVDAPPLLQVGDALTLSGKVDAVFLVVRQNVIKRPLLKELRRVLEIVPSAKLGFCLSGAAATEMYGYGGYYGDYEEAERQALLARRKARSAS